MDTIAAYARRVNPAPFRFRLRVRYGECDGQLIVFNARYGDYADLAITELQRALWGVVQGPGAIDLRVVKQTTAWTAPARFDDVIEIGVETIAIGTTSFTIRCALARWPDAAALASIETVYVVVDPVGNAKRPITDDERAVLTRGAPGVLIDHAASLT